jgi:hypothetical protein
VDHGILAFRINQYFFTNCAHAHHIEAFLGESEIILSLIYKKSRNLGLPELKALKFLKDWALVSLSWEVLYHYVIGIDVDGFVADN